MNNLIVKEFNGNKIHTFMWNNKPCWIANQIVSMFGYAEPKVTISQCIEAEKFEVGVEYEILKSDDLKDFKKLVKNTLTTSELINKYASSLIIFYEDGLYGFLQYTDKPIGVQFRKWIRRDVLPEIRKEGAYITDKANPEMLREKADKLENLSTLNETAKIMISVLERAGLKPQYQALTLKQIYRKGGIDIPIEDIKADKEIYDLTSIADTVGIYSSSNKPHGQAINAIISNLNITDEEKEIVSFERNGHMGTTIQYTKSVIDKVQKWLLENNYPLEILYVDRKGKNKTFHVSYRTLEEVAVCQ